MFNEYAHPSTRRNPLMFSDVSSSGRPIWTRKFFGSFIYPLSTPLYIPFIRKHYINLIGSNSAKLLITLSKIYCCVFFFFFISKAFYISIRNSFSIFIKFISNSEFRKDIYHDLNLQQKLTLWSKRKVNLRGYCVANANGNEDFNKYSFYDSVLLDY